MKYSTHLLIVILLALGTQAKAASVLYVASNFGPFKSTDGGETWKQLDVNVSNPFLNPGIPILQSIAVDPQNPSVVDFSGRSGAWAFYKSTDAGETWTAAVVQDYTFVGGKEQPPSMLAFDSVATNVIYSVATASGTTLIIKSIDAGLTWNPTTHIPLPPDIPPASFPDGLAVRTIATDPNISGVLYAVVGGRLFRSSDFGVTWTILGSTASIGGSTVDRVYVDPRNSQVLYASASGLFDPQNNCASVATNGGQCGLFKSIDGGMNWTGLSLKAPWVDSVAFDTSGGIYAGGARLTGLGTSVVKSTDGGLTWTPLSNQVGEIIKTDPSSPSTVYSIAIGDRDVYKSTDAGATWTHIILPPGCNANQGPSCTGVVFAFDLAVAPPPPLPPAIAAGGVVNAASFEPGVVANAWTTILGTNLASLTDNWNNSIINGRLPTSLDGVSVSIGGKPAYVSFVSSGQLNVLAPDLAPGPVTVTVTTASGASVPVAATASQYGPAFFLWPASQVVATRQDFTLAVKNGTFAGTTTIAAKPGDVIILWGTGFGPSTPAAPVGSVIPADQTYLTSTPATVMINNLSATVYGAALAPGFAGLYQVAIQVPGTLADGDWPIQATIGGVSSPTGAVLSVHQ